MYRALRVQSMFLLAFVFENLFEMECTNFLAKNSLERKVIKSTYWIICSLAVS